MKSGERSNRIIRVGIIGCGQFMSRQHIQTVGRSPILKLQHLSDKNEERLQDLAQRYRAVRQSTRWQDVVTDAEVDVVVVGVVPQLHAEIACAALEHGKPVYVGEAAGADGRGVLAHSAAGVGAEIAGGGRF